LQVKEVLNETRNADRLEHHYHKPVIVVGRASGRQSQLAQKYMTCVGNPKDDIFKRLFLSGETRFGFASINGSQTIPLSARSCKYNSGFIEDKEHGVIDILLPDPDKEEKRCIEANCKHPVDYLEGFWNPETCKKEKIRKRLITRTAIDPVRGSASHEQLYSQRVIEEGQKRVKLLSVLLKCLMI